MAPRKKTWAYRPKKAKKLKPKVPDELIQYLQEKGNELVEKKFKPEYLKPVSEGKTINQIVDIYAKWYRNCFYFCVKYGGPLNRSSLETKFIKFEYLGDDQFQYSYMRHTGKWNPTFKMTADKCLEHASLEILY